jgi:hypothetical protein
MSTSENEYSAPGVGVVVAKQGPWWKDPTKDQWYAFVAAWLGWTLDAFDFTIFLLIMQPIAQAFNVPFLSVTFVFTITLWMRLAGATASGWLCDRIGRKTPLMIAILGYSFCNLAAGLAPRSCLSPAPSSASSWARNGRPVRRWRWKPGRSAPAG